VYHLSQESELDEGEVIKPTDTRKSLMNSFGINMATGEMPSMEEFPGIYDFSLLLGAGATCELKNSKKSWEVTLSYVIRHLFCEKSVKIWFETLLYS